MAVEVNKYNNPFFLISIYLIDVNFHFLKIIWLSSPWGEGSPSSHHAWFIIEIWTAWLWQTDWGNIVIELHTLA